MQFPRALRQLLREFQDGHKCEGAGGLDHLLGTASSEIEQILPLVAIQRRSWNSETTLIALWRAFLSLLPASVLEDPSKRCKEIVRQRLKHLLGEEPEREELALVISVVKRLQRYQRDGRTGLHATPFDLTLASHRTQLRNQGGRCRCCGYRFKERDLHIDTANDEDEQIPRADSTRQSIDAPLSAIDRSPVKIRRQAQLDHVFPIYLAGDHEGNWQVLCSCCNAGKSDLVLGFENRAWFGRARISDLVGATAQLFYMVLRRDGQCGICGRGPSQIELRLTRRDINGANLYTNLTAKCVECLSDSAGVAASAA